MRPLRNIFDDLVERRLWPVALILLAALVIVPVVLAKSAPDTPPAAAPLAAVPAGAAREMTPFVSQPAVQLTSLGQRSSRLDHLRAMNPFVQRHVMRAVVAHGPTTVAGSGTQGAAPAGGGTTATGGSSGARGGGTGTSSASSPAGGRSPTSSGPAPSSGSRAALATGGSPAGPPSPHPPSSVVVSSLDVRFGPAGDPGRRRTVDRLSPLPSRENPVLVYLGLMDDGKTAVFLVSSDAHPDGDGRCVPSPGSCQTLRLRAGDVEFFDVVADDGSVRQYELDLLGVHRQRTSARAASARVAHGARAAGARIVRSAARRQPTVAALRYDEPTGTLRSVEPTPALHADPSLATQLSPDAAVAALGGPPAPASVP